MSSESDMPPVGGRVVDPAGAAATVLRVEGAHVELRLEDGAVVRAPRSMVRRVGEVYRLEVGLWALGAEGEVVVAAVEEELALRRRVVERGGVQVRRTVETVEAEVDEVVHHMRPVVERIAVGRFVERAPLVREEGDRTIVPVVEEVLVVEKRLRLVEEIHIVRRTHAERVRETHPLRRSKVDVIFVGDAVDSSSSEPPRRAGGLMPKEGRPSPPVSREEE